jgi:hypothetical protein
LSRNAVGGHNVISDGDFATTSTVSTEDSINEIYPSSSTPKHMDNSHLQFFTASPFSFVVIRIIRHTSVPVTFSPFFYEVLTRHFPQADPAHRAYLWSSSCYILEAGRLPSQRLDRHIRTCERTIPDSSPKPHPRLPPCSEPYRCVGLRAQVSIFHACVICATESLHS